MAAPNPPLTPDQKIEQMQAEIDALKAPKSSSIVSTIMAHWKSTANGLLGLAITTGVVLLATGSTLLTPKMTMYITLGLALARGYVLVISKDASAITQADISKQTAVATAKQT